MNQIADGLLLIQKKLMSHTEIEEIFAEIAPTDGLIDAETFLQWLKSSQGESDLSSQKVLKLFAQLESDRPNPQKLTSKGFENFLTSSLFSGILAQEHQHVCQDMDKDLKDYFISSSHNTFLIGDQLKGESSVEGYTKAFSLGCRCVEVDVWDNEKEPTSPLCYHGHTLTSRITFEDVIQTIHDHGFQKQHSDSPVILSMEVHCKDEGQRAMACILLKVLGENDMLPNMQPESRYSPKSLSKKVLLKGKATLPELKEMIRLQPGIHVTSFNESKFQKLRNQDPQAFLSQISNQLIRIYPKSVRVDSSNFDPTPAWNLGCQMVAINYQSPGMPKWIEQAKFRENGGCGYVLKAFPLDDTSNPIILTIKIIKVIGKLSRSSKVKTKESSEASSQFAPYVRISIFGTSRDTISHQTAVIENSDKNPSWFEPKAPEKRKPRNLFSFVVENRDLAIVLFTLHDDNISSSDDVIAQYGLPFQTISKGYHCVPFCDRDGNEMDLSLLVQIV